MGRCIESIYYYYFIVNLSVQTSGLVDDFLKLSRGNSDGLSAKLKFLLQWIAALLLAFLLFFNAESSAETTLIFPFFKNINYELGLFYLFTTSLVIVSTSNSVNLSDGLDGLAIMPTVMIGGALIILAYVQKIFLIIWLYPMLEVSVKYVF